MSIKQPSLHHHDEAVKAIAEKLPPELYIMSLDVDAPIVNSVGGIVTHVPRRVAAHMIHQGVAREATDQEIANFKKSEKQKAEELKKEREAAAAREAKEADKHEDLPAREPLQHVPQGIRETVTYENGRTATAVGPCAPLPDRSPDGSPEKTRVRAPEPPKLAAAPLPVQEHKPATE